MIIKKLQSTAIPKRHPCPAASAGTAGFHPEKPLFTIRTLVAGMFIAAALTSLSSTERANALAKENEALPDLMKYQDYPAVVLEKKFNYTVKKQRLPELIKVEGKIYYKTEEDIDLIENELQVEEVIRVVLLSEKGIEMYGDYELEVYRDKDDLEIDAKVILPGGKTIKVKGKNIHEIKIGKNYRQKRITFPGLVVNSIIDLKIKRKTKFIVHLGEYGAYQIGEKVPVLNAEIRFVMPEFYELKFKFYPRDFVGSEGIKTSRKDGLQIQELIFKDLHPCKEEPFMPAVLENTPRFYYVVGTDMEYPIEFGGMRYPALFGPIGYLSKIYYGTYSAKKLKELEKKVVNYVKNKGMDLPFETHEAKVDAVLDIFHEEFEVAEKELRWDDPLECMEKKTGSCFGIAYVLGKVYQSLGFRVVPVFVLDRRYGYRDERVKDFRRLTRLLLRVQSGKEVSWIDPLISFAKANQLRWDVMGLSGRGVFEDGTTRDVSVPASTCSDNLMREICKAKIDDNGDMRATIKSYLTGQNYLKFRKRLEDKEDFEKYIQESYQLIEGTIVEKENIITEDKGDTLIIECKVKWPGYARVLEDMIYFDIRFLEPRSLFERFKAEEREFDIAFAYPLINTSEVEIEFPRGYSLESGEGTTSLSEEYMSYNKAVNSSGTTLVIKRTFTIKRTEIPKGDYDNLKAFLKSAHEADRAKIVLEKAGS